MPDHDALLLAAADALPLPLGTPTKWGPIRAVGMTGGERYYWMVDGCGCVSMMPADVVEDQRRPNTAAVTPTASAHSSR